DGVNFRIDIASSANRFEHDVDADAIVEALADNHVSDFLEIAAHGHHVSDLDNRFHLFRGHPEINEKVVEVEIFFIVWPHKVDWLHAWHEGADQSSLVSGVNSHALGYQCAWIEPAHRL